MMLGGRVPGGMRAEQGLRKGGDLGECQFDFGVRLEVYAGDGDAGIGLRLDVLDVVHAWWSWIARRMRPCVSPSLPGEAVVVPDDTDYGDIDIRERYRPAS